MKRNPEAFSKQTFDLVVIGGGVNGAATAREAVLRGLKVALIEARDFASGTSSRSSKLIHGGLRYLKQLEFKLVHEARRERRWLLEHAPHLAIPLPFLLPIYEDDPYSPFEIRLGLSIYDLLGNLGNSDRHRMHSAEEALRLIPGLRSERLRAAAVYHDSETDDARLTLEYILDAARHGAVVANYAEVRAFRSAANAGGRAAVTSAEVEDVLAGRRYEIASRFWVNATGPWVDSVRGLLAGSDGSKTVRLTKGTHLIIPPVSGDCALLAAIPPGERIFVLVPWHGRALLGTTDTDYEGAPEHVHPEREDAEYLLRAVNRVLRQPLGLKDVAGWFSGLRALALQPGASPSENTREYRFHEDPWAANFITVCGGKLTTARSLGEKLLGRVAVKLGMSSSRSVNPPRRATLPGGETGLFEPYVRTESAEAGRLFGIAPAVAQRIVRTYGSRWRNVLDPIRQDSRLRDPLAGEPGLLPAEVAFAIEEEMAVRLEDFVLRRSGLNWFAPRALREALPAIAAIFAERFAWSVEQRNAAVQSFANSAYNPNL